MRPILLASAIRAAPISYDTAPGTYSPGATFTITATAPVVWNYTSTGNLPGCNVPNGGTASSITFALTAGRLPKDCEITINSGGLSWVVDLETEGATP